MKQIVRRVKRAGRALAGRDLFQRKQVDVPVEEYGAEHARWAVYPRRLAPESVVYSFGVGEDISFDVALIERFGLRVHAFDPTPRSRAWIQRQQLPDRLTFHPFGVAGFDGTATFHAPANPAFVSYSMVDGKGAGPSVEAPVYRLRTLMDRLGHDHVDLLKMDIEGAEYEVIDDLIDSGADVRQLLVEFHHRFPQIGAGRTREAIRRLNEHGYRIFHVSSRGEEYAFLRL